MKSKSQNTALTVLTIVVGFATVYWISMIEAFLYVSLGIGVLGILSSRVRDVIDNLWGLLTKILSYIVPNIILTLVFFLFLTPVAFLAKLFGKKDPLKLKNKEASLYVTQEKQFSKKSFENMF